jgi:multidrug transporter EmrE-like cation transporter
MFWFCIAAVATGAPILLVKNYIKTHELYWLFLALLSYIVLIIAYSYILKKNDMTIIYALLKSVSILGVAFAGFIFFDEKLCMRATLGILLGIASVYLLSTASS